MSGSSMRGGLPPVDDLPLFVCKGGGEEEREEGRGGGKKGGRKGRK